MNPWESNYKTHQGNFGLGRAIAYYTGQCIPVMIPLNDSQKYDLVIDSPDKGLQRVSVKTTQGKSKSRKFQVQLKNSTLGSDHNTIRRFDNTTCDILFIVTIDGNIYEIPTSNVNATCSITLNEDYDQYLVRL